MNTLEYEQTVVNLDNVVKLTYTLGTIAQSLKALDIHTVHVTLVMADGDRLHLTTPEAVRELCYRISKDSQREMCVDGGLKYYAEKWWKYTEDLNECKRLKRRKGITA
jgi:hypothetical protein